MSCSSFADERHLTARVMSRKMAEYAVDNKFTDIVLDVDGKDFSCHKAWLCASSPYFERMFSSMYMEKDQHRITLRCISQQAFNQIYSYVYTGKMNLNTENVIDVYSAADLLLYDDVKKAALEYMCYDINTHDCVEYLLFGLQMNIHRLVYTTKQFLIWKSLHVEADIHEIPYEIFLEIIESDDFAPTNEDSILDVIHEYIESCDRIEEAQKLYLLNSIRWGHINGDKLDTDSCHDDLTRERFSYWKPLLEKYTRSEPNERMIIEKEHEKEFDTRGEKEVCYFGGWKYMNSSPCTNIVRCRFGKCMEMPTPVCCTAVVKFGNHIIVMGGKSVNVTAYDIERQSWHVLSPLPQERWQHVAVALDNYILAIGGRNNEDAIVSWVDKYDIQENKWTHMRPFKKITHLRGCCYNNEVYVYGGYYRTPSTKSVLMAQGGWKNNSIYKYNARDDTWIKVINIPRKLRHFIIGPSCIRDNKIYLRDYFGPSCMVFDPVDNSICLDTSNIEDIDFIDTSQSLVPVDKCVWSLYDPDPGYESDDLMDTWNLV